MGKRHGKALATWAEELGISYRTLQARILQARMQRGWSSEGMSEGQTHAARFPTRKLWWVALRRDVLHVVMKRPFGAGNRKAWCGVVELGEEHQVDAIGTAETTVDSRPWCELCLDQIKTATGTAPSETPTEPSLPEYPTGEAPLDEQGFYSRLAGYLGQLNQSGAIERLDCDDGDRPSWCATLDDGTKVCVWVTADSETDDEVVEHVVESTTVLAKLVSLLRSLDRPESNEELRSLLDRLESLAGTVDPRFAPCGRCAGSGRVPKVESWLCTICEEIVDPSMAWALDGPHRVRHVEGSPICRRG